MTKQIQHAYIYYYPGASDMTYSIKYIGYEAYRPYEKDGFNNLNDAIHSLQDKGYKMVAIRGENEFWFVKEND